MAPSPMTDTDGPIGILIKSNGTPLSDEVAILSVRIRRNVDGVPEAVIAIVDGSIATNEFPLTDGTVLKPGAEIEIAAWYGDHAAEILFKGIVTGQRLHVEGNSGTVLDVTCHHPAIQLQSGAKSRIWAETRDVDVMRDLVGSLAGLSGRVEATDVTHSSVVQFEVSDWALLKRRADANGMWVACRDDEISIEVADPTSEPMLTLTLGFDVLSFDAGISASDQYAAFKTRSWDVEGQKMKAISVEANPLGKWGNLSSAELSAVSAVSGGPKRTELVGVGLPEETLRIRSTGAMNRANLCMIFGTVSFPGNGAVDLNTTLELKGFGERFSGVGIVSGFEHNILGGNWVTTATLGKLREPQDRVEARRLFTGIVHSLDEDPLGQRRIQIFLPEIDAGAVPVWARLGHSHPSKDAVIPEIGDEVIVGFMDGSGHIPIVLGRMHT